MPRIINKEFFFLSNLPYIKTWNARDLGQVKIIFTYLKLVFIKKKKKKKKKRSDPDELLLEK